MFSHLHVHSLHSDGLATPQQLISCAASHGFTALALTDHNTFDGHSSFLSAANDYNLIPLLGVEAPIHIRERRGHAVLLPRNTEEYEYTRWLLKRKKRIQIGDLPRVGIVTSGCLGGIPAQRLKYGDYWAARDVLLELRDELGEQFYIEIQPSFGAILPWLLTLSRELHIPAVATNDVHYLAPDDALRHPQTGLYLASEDQMRGSCPYHGYQEALDATQSIVQQCSAWTGHAAAS